MSIDWEETINNMSDKRTNRIIHKVSSQSALMLNKIYKKLDDDIPDEQKTELTVKAYEVLVDKYFK